MSSDNLDSLDAPFLSRQQRIADLLRSTLPEIEAGQRRGITLRRILVAVALVFFFAGGFSIGQLFRPLSYSEKMIVQTLIVHAAQQQNKTADEVKHHLLTEIGAHSLREMHSSQMSDALYVLGQYFD